MNIGEFKKNARGTFVGYIATATIDLPRLALLPVESNNSSAPALEIVTRSPSGRTVQVGALWEASARETGETFYQGHVEDPSLPNKLYIAMFGSGSDEEGYRVAWNRPKPQAERDGQRGNRRTAEGAGGFGESTAGADGRLATVDDEIPL